MSRGNKPPGKDMYWFAHGGAESDKNQLRNPAEGDEDLHNSNSPTWNTLVERKGSPEATLGSPHIVVDGSGSSGPPSLEREDRLRAFDKRLAVEERKKQLWEAEQERNDAALKKRMEREAALEARRNAQRSNISFAFGSSVPRNVEMLHANEGDSDIMSRSFTAGGLSQKGEDFMSRSMSSAISSAPRGRRKNDLMPTVPYERNPTPRAATSSSTRKRSVSMTRLDQLAQPRRHYVEANKANSTASSGASSTLKDVKSPTRPLSSASENSGGSGRVPGAVTRRVRSSPRKPRPFSIAGTIPDLKPVGNSKPFDAKLSPVKRSYTPTKKATDTNETKKNGGLPIVKCSTPKSLEKAKPAPRTTTSKPSTPKTATPKPTPPKSKTTESKQPAAKSTPVSKTSTPKVKDKKAQPIKKKVDTVVSSPPVEMKEKTPGVEKLRESPPPPLDSDVLAENEKNNAKRIISEEEAKAALAEKRRLAREQAEREAELERQRQEELKRQEEEQLRQEEEEHRKMEEEQIRLLEEHRRQEEEKLRKAIEDQEHKEEEERAKRDEEIRLKAEQEKKAKEEAEKQRLELEEKLRKEEEERAERKKRLEKIMSRTRGKSSGTSPSGSVSGSDQLDSSENPHEGFSSGANSLDSNETGELPSEPVSMDDNMTKAEISSTGDSMENNPTYEIGSENESLNSNDLMMPLNETASQDNSLVIIPDKAEQRDEAKVTDAVDESSTALSADVKDEVAAAALNPSQSDIPASASTETVEPSSSQSSSQIEETSVAFTSDAQVPSTVLPESAEVPPVESHSFTNEDIEVGSQSFGISVQDMHVNKELGNQMFQQRFENEQFFTQEQVVNMGESDVLKSEFPKDDESQQNVESSGMNMPINDDTDCELSLEKSVQDTVPSQPNDFTVDHSQFENSSSGGIDVDYPVETEFSEINRSSISSDIKLPDPIYETSDDGSVSSEKQLQDFKSVGNHEEFGFGKNAGVVDDVFSEQAAPSNPELNPQNPFGEDTNFGSPNPFGVVDDTQRSESNDMNQFQHQFGESHQYNMSESMFEEKETFILPDVLEQPHELDGGNVLPSEYSAFIQQENGSGATQQLNTDAFESQFSNFTNTENDNQVNPFSKESEGVDAFANQFSNAAPEAYGSSDNGNMFPAPTPFTSNEILQSDSGAAGDNPFVGNSSTDSSLFHNLETQAGDFSEVQQRVTIESQQVGFEEQAFGDGEFFPESEKLRDDVTFIKDDSSGACVGIISSVDHDHVSNDFPKQLLRSEHLKNNFECASMTDSEDSSLDSNLSQVMTVESSEKDTIGGLIHLENSILESNSSNLVTGNGDQHDNPFTTDHIYNNGSISKSNGSSFSASQVYSNGHGLESSKPEQTDELHDYLQLDGNDISSVDHLKNNMYENVDAIEYSKVSSDPFLAKGNSKQISGNPFLLQDDQKQVLMTPDFLN